MIGCLCITKTSVTLPNITLPCIFQNQVCVFFSMDKWIFGCLTTYAYDLGGTQEVSNFWADERMIWYSAIILTSITLPFATLPLLPYTCNLTVVGPMKCLIFELMNGWSDVLVLPRHPLSYQTQPYLAFFKIRSVYLFQWISGYMDAWLPMHMILVAPRKCLIFERMNRWLDVLLSS